MAYSLMGCVDDLIHWLFVILIYCGQTADFDHRILILLFYLSSLAQKEDINLMFVLC